MPSCVCRSGCALGCDVRSEQFGRRGGHRAGAEPASRESENQHFSEAWARGPRRGVLSEAVSGDSENRSLLLGLGDGVSGESEILAETSFVYSVGSVFSV